MVAYSSSKGEIVSRREEEEEAQSHMKMRDRQERAFHCPDHHFLDRS